jgi:precorrin-2/cobalt-factor-2 C20-methyltransferase
MKLFCVGCGPGDPDLLTLKAVDLIKNSDVIFTPTARDGKPSIALSVVNKYIAESTEIVSLTFPMTKEMELLKDYWKKNTETIAQAVISGRKAVYLTIGDPALYSTWIYIQRELKKDHPEIEVDIVPGITSFFAFAAKAKLSLAEGDQTVGIIPACYDLSKVKQAAESCDTLIFLKDGRYFDNVIEMLSTSGFKEDSVIAIAQDLSSNQEVIILKKLKDLHNSKGTTQKYFSVMVAKKTID